MMRYLADFFSKVIHSVVPKYLVSFLVRMCQKEWVALLRHS
jgi:hypothetical protein